MRLIAALSDLAQGRYVVIADAGLPIPAGSDLLDLSVVASVPSFEDVLRAVTSEIVVERVLLAHQMLAASSELAERSQRILDGVRIDWIDHEEIKQMVCGARIVVRTGECTPYANAVVVGTDDNHGPSHPMHPSVPELRSDVP